MTLREMTTKFRAWYQTNTRPATQKTFDSVCRRLLDHYGGGVNLNDFVAYDTVVYQNVRRSQGAANGTINKELTVFKRMFNLGIEWGFLTVPNPVGRMLETKPAGTFLTKEGIDHLLATCQAQSRALYLAVLIGLSTGLRKSDILSLSYRKHVRFDDKVIIKEIAKRKGGFTVCIPMADTLAGVLAEEHARASSDWLFPSPVKPGEHVRVDSEMGFAAAVKKAGLPPMRFHDLRHTFASQFAMATGNLGVLQDILGHSDPKMTRRYTHFCQQFTAGLMKQLPI